VRAIQILHGPLSKRMGFMHAARWLALWRAVQALVKGRQLWLTGLGRSLPGAVLRKHAIKAVDRLLGSEHLYDERLKVSAALVRMLIGAGTSPVVLVDTVEIRYRVVAVTAALAHEGRSFPFHSMIIGQPRADRRQCDRFLQQLSEVLPSDCRPVFLTDGGFESTWFDEVERRGWHYVGRVRGQAKLFFEGHWVRCQQLHGLATRRAWDLGMIALPMRQPRWRRIVISKKPISLHRRRRTRRGLDNDSNYLHYRKNVYEPLLLATSLPCSSQRIVALYRRRMQIEETFRDLKNHRWGWSLRHCGSRSSKRIEILLLIAALAVAIQQLAGAAAESLSIQRRHQANTVTRTRVLSIFVLGGLVLNGADAALLTADAIHRAAARLRRHIALLGHPTG